MNKKTIELLNPGQTPVDVCDQPVFALTWELQQRAFKEKFSPAKYFSLLGGFHIEKFSLEIHGEFVKEQVMTIADLRFLEKNLPKFF